MNRFLKSVMVIFSLFLLLLVNIPHKEAAGNDGDKEVKGEKKFHFTFKDKVNFTTFTYDVSGRATARLDMETRTIKTYLNFDEVTVYSSSNPKTKKKIKDIQLGAKKDPVKITILADKFYSVQPDYFSGLSWQTDGYEADGGFEGELSLGLNLPVGNSPVGVGYSVTYKPDSKNKALRTVDFFNLKPIKGKKPNTKPSYFEMEFKDTYLKAPGKYLTIINYKATKTNSSSKKIKIGYEMPIYFNNTKLAKKTVYLDLHYNAYTP